MPEIDALLLIDANKYLDLYRTDQGRKLLALLTEQAPNIFITQQIVNEVQRNKLNVAADFLKTKSQGLKLQNSNVPDHFSGAEIGKNQEILSQMRDINSAVKSVNADIDNHTLEIMTQVAESKDEVSIALAPIFSKAVRATQTEMERARARKEIGNPPGKRNDPIGDEITWEQVLSSFAGKKRLWIISRDGDYSAKFGETFFLNSFLKSELSQITENPTVYIFAELGEGLAHFISTTQEKVKINLTAEELTEIETEEKSLPPVGSSHYEFIPAAGGFSATEIQQAWNSIKPANDALKAFSAIRSFSEAKNAFNSSGIQRAIDSMKPFMEATQTLYSKEIQQAIDATRSLAEVQQLFNTSAVQGAIDAIKPFVNSQKAFYSMEMQSAIEAMKPFMPAHVVLAEAQRYSSPTNPASEMQRAIAATKGSDKSDVVPDE